MISPNYAQTILAAEGDTDIQLGQIASLTESALNLHRVDFEKSRATAEQALELLAAIDKTDPRYERAYAECQAVLSIYHYNTGQYDPALCIGIPPLQTLKTIEKSKFLPPLIGFIGATMARIGEFSEAAAHFRDQLAVSIQQKDLANEARAHIGMGMVYGETGRAEEALKVTNRALNLYKKLGDIEAQILVYNNISYAYIHLKNYSKAMEAAWAGLELSESQPTHPHKGKLLNNIGVAYHEQGDHLKSLAYLKKALRHAKATSDIFLIASINFTIGETFLDRNQPNKAIALQQRSLKFATLGNSTSLVSRVHQELSKAYRMIGQHEKALVHFEQFFKLHSSTFDNSNATKLAALEIKYQTEVAERKAELMQEMNGVLEQRIADRTEALQDALERESSLTEKLTSALDAEAQISDLRAQIITVVSHEFRTSLTVINTSTDLLDYKSDRMNGQMKAKHFNKIRGSLGYLAGLLDDMILLNLANSAEFSVNRSSIHTNTIRESLQQEFDALYPNRQIILDWSNLDLEHVSTDLTNLIVLLSKIVENAVKFSQPDTPVVVTAKREGPQFTIAVADSGLGMPEVDVPHLFEPFYRGANISTIRGLGLGLHIAQSIATALGAVISAESAGLNLGSTFIVKLPL